jgi:acyl transferase domain-containing protein
MCINAYWCIVYVYLPRVQSCANLPWACGPFYMAQQPKEWERGAGQPVRAALSKVVGGDSLTGRHSALPQYTDQNIQQVAS